MISNSANYFKIKLTLVLQVFKKINKIVLFCIHTNYLSFYQYV